MAVINYTPSTTKIIHNTRVDWRERKSTQQIHLVQYDDSLPIVKVDLFMDGQPYTLPANADVRVRWGKKDRTYVYKSVLGCTPDRQTVYFEIDNQMTVLYGDVTPILELSLLGRKAGSSPMYITVDRNPIQNGDVESSNDLPILDNLLEQAEAARDAALISETKAKTSETNAKSSETNSLASQNAAKTSETNAKASETAAKAAQTASETARSTATTKATEASNSAAAALASQNAAKTSETNSKTSETNSKASETAANTSRTNAASSASTASTKATEAANSAAAALASKNAAGTSETNAKASETAAKAAQTASKTSETNSKASETAAKSAQTAAETAKTQAQTAKTQAETAKTGAEAALSQLSDEVQLAQNARTGAESAQAAASASQTAAKTSETNSKSSETAAKASQTASKTSETNASSSASTASTKVSEASASATAAKNAQTAAETARSTATTKATEASNSAASALASQNAAKTSETNAKSARTAAETARDQAQTIADNMSSVDVDVDMEDVNSIIASYTEGDSGNSGEIRLESLSGSMANKILDNGGLYITVQTYRRGANKTRRWREFSTGNKGSQNIIPPDTIVNGNYVPENMASTMFLPINFMHDNKGYIYTGTTRPNLETTDMTAILRWPYPFGKTYYERSLYRKISDSNGVISRVAFVPENRISIGYGTFSPTDSSNPGGYGPIQLLGSYPAYSPSLQSYDTGDRFIFKFRFKIDLPVNGTTSIYTNNTSIVMVMTSSDDRVSGKITGLGLYR